MSAVAGRSRGFWWRLGAALLSGVLMAAAFPPFEESEAAWFCLVPLILLSRFTRPSSALRWGWVSGLAFWGVALTWLLRLGETGVAWPVAILGWAALAVYCALYTGIFAMLSAGLLCRERTPQTLHRMAMVCLLPLVWVGLEYVRATFGTGFPWNALGISQYRNIAMLQTATIFGVFGVSAVVVVMNTAIAMTSLRFIDLCLRRASSSRRGLNLDLMLGLLICAVAWSQGIRSVRAYTRAAGQEKTTLRVACIQPNIPQQKKWTPESSAAVYQSLSMQTDLALLGRPELVVWPETALPYPVRTDAQTRAFVADLAKDGTPILAGTLDGTLEELYNASLLITHTGDVVGEYRKQHLVPFGEYVPFSRQFPILGRFAPLGFNCARGQESAIFRVGAAAQIPFSVLICFEDCFAYLARNAYRAGARLLINQTNDAWFDGSSGPVQHLSHSVFRAVENRLPVVRCANSGVTCFIDPVGRFDALRNGSGSFAFPGYALSGVRVPVSRHRPTLYTRFGDILLAMPAAMLLLPVSIFVMWRARRGEED